MGELLQLSSQQSAVKWENKLIIIQTRRLSHPWDSQRESTIHMRQYGGLI